MATESAVSSKILEKSMSRAFRAFREFNSIRLEKTLETLNREEQKIFICIPYLLHLNEKDIPGFIEDEETPFGIANFEWSSKSLGLLRELFPECRVQKKTLPKKPIESLALMGSCGSIAMTKKSDFDFWLCVDSTRFTERQLELIGQKCKAIEAWADGKNLEVHFFINDLGKILANKFGHADEESSGSALGYLLKEEFYRTFIILEGKYPVWSVVPARCDDALYDRCAEIIQNSTELDRHNFADFGNIQHIPLEEYYGATLWQIVKGYKNPFKSLLKMGILEVYFRNMENPEHLLLCNSVKMKVHSLSTPLCMIDPYVAMFKALIDHNAATGNKDKDRLLKICFYLKTGFSVRSAEECAKRMNELGTKLDRKETNWLEVNELIFHRQFSKWGWNNLVISDLNAFSNWPFDKVKNLGEQINTFTLDIYRSLTGDISRIKVKHMITAVDITVLGRKIQSLYRELPDKVSNVYHIKDEHVEQILTFYQHDSEWSLYKTSVSKSTADAKSSYILRTAASIHDLVFWIIHNDIYRPNITSVSVKSDDPAVGAAFMKGLLDELYKFFPQVKVSSIANSKLLSKPLIEKILFMCYEPDCDHQNDEVREIILTCFFRNTWGEQFVTNIATRNPITAALNLLQGNLLADYRTATKEEIIRIYNPMRTNINFKVKKTSGEGFHSNLMDNLFRQLKPWLPRWLKKQDRSEILQYVSGYGEGYILVIKHTAFISSVHETKADLFNAMTKTSCRPVSTFVDPDTPGIAHLAKAVELHNPGFVDIFVQKFDTHEDFLIIDEIGNTIYFQSNLYKFTKTFKSQYTFIKNTVEAKTREGSNRYASKIAAASVRFVDITDLRPQVIELNSRNLYDIISSTKTHYIEVAIEKIRTGGFFFQFGEEDIVSTRMHENPMECLADRLSDAITSRGENDYFIVSIFLEENFQEKYCDGEPATAHYLLYRNILARHLELLLSKRLVGPTQ